MVVSHELEIDWFVPAPPQPGFMFQILFEMGLTNISLPPKSVLSAVDFNVDLGPAK